MVTPVTVTILSLTEVESRCKVIHFPIRTGRFVYSRSNIKMLCFFQCLMVND